MTPLIGKRVTFAFLLPIGEVRPHHIFLQEKR